MALIIWIVCQNLVSIIAGVLIVPIFKDVLTESEFNLITMIITMLSGLLLGSLFIFSYTNKNEKIAKKKLSLVKKIEIIFIGIFLIGIVQITLPYLYELFNLEYLVGDIIPYKAQENIFTDILLVICISIIPGIFEELFFRKAIMDYSNKIGKVFAVILSSIIFSVVHMNIAQSMFALEMGIIFGIIYAVTGDIVLTMILHLLNNGYSAICSIFMYNSSAIDIIMKIALLFVIIGALVVIKNIYINREKIKNINLKKINKLNLSEYKYLFCDYTFLLSTGVIIILFALTEKMLVL